MSCCGGHNGHGHMNHGNNGHNVGRTSSKIPSIIIGLLALGVLYYFLR